MKRFLTFTLCQYEKYIIKLRVPQPYKHVEIESDNFHQALIKAEEIADKEGLIFEDIKPVSPNDEYDYVIHKVENLKEF